MRLSTGLKLAQLGVRLPGWWPRSLNSNSVMVKTINRIIVQLKIIFVFMASVKVE